ncbi:MAG TPA: serine/threonine-protein kinase [Gemmataceae bacterium]|nr:serine/threonine-protein kinase [Gemmataceae bacterium]
MSISVSLIAFGVRYVLDVPVDTIVHVIEARMTDHSHALLKALARANDRAWQAVGLALAGEGLFERVKDVFRDGDLKGIRDQIRKFLDNTPTGLETANPAVRAKAAEEWCRLRKGKRLSAEAIPPAVVARRASALERYSDPARLTLAAHRAVADTAAALREEAPHLSDLLTKAPPNGVPLLSAAFGFFFRREVETSSEIARGLTFELLRQLTDRQERGFLELEASLGARVGLVRDKLDGLFDALGDWFAKLGRSVEEIHARLNSYDETLSLLRDFLKRNDVPTSSSKPPSVTVAGEDELQRLRIIRDALRSLPPGLLTAADWLNLGHALRAAGLFTDAGSSDEAAAEAAKASSDRVAEGRAEINRFKDACETAAWDKAAAALRRAVEIDRAEYQPFDWLRYELVAVLGAGGFGTVFHCLDRFDLDPDTNRPIPVAIKTLHHDGLDRTVDVVFREARTLKKLDHPHIIGIRDQDYAQKIDEKTLRRPYFVLEYFAGQTLEAYLKQHRILPVADLLPLAYQIAVAVHAAHTAGVLHRDLKPANILIARTPDGGWDIRVIDFGLAVKLGSAARASVSIPSDRRASQDRSFAGTLRYAAPEQMGNLPGVPVGRYSDVFAFGRTCIESLFGTTNPQEGHWRKLPVAIRETVRLLFGRCVTDHLEAVDDDLPGRFADFKPVIAALASLTGQQADSPAPGAEPLEEPPAPAPLPTDESAKPKGGDVDSEGTPLLPTEPTAKPPGSHVDTAGAVLPEPENKPGAIVIVKIPSVDRGPKPGTRAAFCSLKWKPVLT